MESSGDVPSSEAFSCIFEYYTLSGIINLGCRHWRSTVIVTGFFYTLLEHYVLKYPGNDILPKSHFHPPITEEEKNPTSLLE